MKQASWWYNLTWQERCNYRDLCKVDIMTAELIDIAFEMYSVQ